MPNLNPRSVTFLNEQGDTTIAWTADRDEEMEALIARKMEQGVTFFIIEERGLRSRLNNASEAARHGRALAILDADFAQFVGEGKGELVPTPSEKTRTKKISRNPKEVASSQSVGVRQMAGG